MYYSLWIYDNYDDNAIKVEESDSKEYLDFKFNLYGSFGLNCAIVTEEE